MSAAIMAIIPFLASAKGWELVAQGALSTGTSVSAPANVKARDLLVCEFAYATGGNTRKLPAGWEWMFPETTAARHCFKIVQADSAAAESIWPNSTSSGTARIAQLRPTGGWPYLASKDTNTAATNITLAAPDSPGALICAGTAIAAATWTTKTHPAFADLIAETTTTCALYAGWAKLDALASTGAMRITGSSSYRQYHAIFGIKSTLDETFEFTISSNAAGPSIQSLAYAAGWGGRTALVCNITAPLIRELNIPASDSYPNGLRVNISAGTRIGGRGGWEGLLNPTTALTVGQAVTIDNLGIISGGGGAGGPGGSAHVVGWYGSVDANGGGGGQGQGFTASPSDSLVVQNAAAGNAGETATTSDGYKAYGGTGGTGGNWGAAGQAGDGGSNSGGLSGTSTTGGGNGQEAGKAVQGNSYITWINTGTRLGVIA